MWRIAGLLLLIPQLSLAQGLQQSGASAGALSKHPYDYYCTGSNGERYELGEVICITASSCQVWLAKCDMSLNNPMWRKVQDGCPTASLLDRIHALQPGFDPGLVYSAIASPKT
jgi:hypothetical protein